MSRRRNKRDRQRTPTGRETPVLSDGGERSRDEVLADFRKVAAPQRHRDRDRTAKS